MTTNQLGAAILIVLIVIAGLLAVIALRPPVAQVAPAPCFQTYYDPPASNQAARQPHYEQVPCN